jgi:hypothetical protein
MFYIMDNKLHPFVTSKEIRMTIKYIPRKINLEARDYAVVKKFAQEKGLGAKGFSAALRMIIREWLALSQPTKPS